MTQGVLRRLGGGVGTFRKGAEGGNIDKEPLIPAANVQLPGYGGYHGLRRHGGLAGDVEAGSEVVGAALGQIAQRRPVLQPHQAGDDLVQRAVAANGHHGVEAGSLRGGDLGGFAGSAGTADGQQITGAAEDRRRVKQRPPGLVPAGLGIDDHHQLFLLH